LNSPGPRQSPLNSKVRLYYNSAEDGALREKISKFRGADRGDQHRALGVLTGGEELHNNHHAFPSSASFAVRAWEIDMGWLWICLFRALALAGVGSLAPTPNIGRDRPGIDADTVRALITNRMHVLRDYRRRVVRPVFRELTKQQSPAVLAHRSPQLLVRHPKLLERYEVLRTVVEFSDRLQQIWAETSASHGRALEQLRELCTQAEGSSILALRKFALRLRTYAPSPGSP
jgi:stearoyl-CoA desaturase (Delta-9 desaturase)